MQKPWRTSPKHFTIADAKPGAISADPVYARAFFETLDFDAVTVAPYMGELVTPFLGFEGKWVILLALTSTRGSRIFKTDIQENGKPLYGRSCGGRSSGVAEQLMFVISATHPEQFEGCAVSPRTLLAGSGYPGAREVVTGGYATASMIIAVCWSIPPAIIFAGDGEDFAERRGRRRRW